MTIKAKDIKVTAEKIQKARQARYDKVYRMSQLIPIYAKFAKDAATRKLFFGFPRMDKSLGGIRPPELLSIIAFPSVGKSQLVLNILRNQALYNKMLVDKLLLYYSMEMGEIDIIERMLQTELMLTSFELERKFREHPKDMEEEAYKLVKKFDNIVPIINPYIDANELIHYTTAIADILEQDIGGTVLDYVNMLDNIESKGEYERITKNMRAYKDLTLALQLPVINVAQVTRKEEENKEGLRMQSGKGSGAIEEASQIVLGLELITDFSKHGIDIATAKEVSDGKILLLLLKVLKKKRGEFLKDVIVFNKRTLLMEEYNKPATLGEKDYDEKPF